jgi:hypothetical protein
MHQSAVIIVEVIVSLQRNKSLIYSNGCFVMEVA